MLTLNFKIIMMKNIIYFVCLSVVFVSCAKSQQSHFKEIEKFQNKMNKDYANPNESPLTKKDLETFKKLDFFKIDEKFKIKADFQLTPDAEIFAMQTTTSRLPLYRKFGIATFELDGVKCELSLYQNQSFMDSEEYGNLLFLPFNDLSNGEKSYGGGRFIDIEIPNDNNKTIVIDFNKAYNPYCAYNDRYSCPVPPSENYLNVEILAGVKKYNNH